MSSSGVPRNRVKLVVAGVEGLVPSCLAARMSGKDKFFDDRCVGRARRTWFFVCVERAL